jgi:GT2 family glycosyltransferase
MDKSSQLTVFVIVLNYNGKNTLNSCLSSVYQSTYPKFEVVVVDNDSQDGSFELAKKDFARAHFIKNPSNIGFARGNNIGIRFALEKFADYVFLLNNDAILKKETLSQLVELATKNKFPGIINPLILKADQSVWFAGGTIDWLRMKTSHLTKTFSDNQYATEYCTGCAMLIDKEVFKKIGLFDERYFLYYEDADFSVRAQKAGFELSVCPSAKVFHFEQSNRKNDLKIYWLVLSGLLFFFLNTDFFQKIWLFGYVWLRKLKNLYLVSFRPSTKAFQIKKAFQDFKKIKAS